MASEVNAMELPLVDRTTVATTENTRTRARADTPGKLTKEAAMAEGNDEASDTESSFDFCESESETGDDLETPSNATSPHVTNCTASAALCLAGGEGTMGDIMTLVAEAEESTAEQFTQGEEQKVSKTEQHAPITLRKHLLAQQADYEAHIGLIQLKGREERLDERERGLNSFRRS
ncbi:hypothetical protein LTR36_004857 [Oleoguttula mirabilis]|uniref:Uncharacterized protein n=1 Tax=Oleoguttula mirabilis TaxID=1507867 RepID=A0AAV9JEZ6_9PEZI|nr:hypothetical protein LTR36_004857 [Oleoguttula mirabilis]